LISFLFDNIYFFPKKNKNNNKKMQVLVIYRDTESVFKI
jgi:hypothetical protein